MFITHTAVKCDCLSALEVLINLRVKWEFFMGLDLRVELRVAIEYANPSPLKYYFLLKIWVVIFPVIFETFGHF